MANEQGARINATDDFNNLLDDIKELAEEDAMFNCGMLEIDGLIEYLHDDDIFDIFLEAIHAYYITCYKNYDN